MIEVEKLNTKLNFLITKLFENGDTALKFFWKIYEKI